MSIAAWFTWAADLSDIEAASAFLGAGITPRHIDQRDAATRWISDELQRKATLFLRWMPRIDRAWGHALTPRDLGAAWEEAQRLTNRQPFGSTIALPTRQMTPDGPPWFDAGWIRELEDVCQRAGLAAQLVFHGRAHGPSSWSWPVRIGVLTELPDLGGFASLRRHWWWGRLFHLSGARAGSQRFDLMLVDDATPLPELRSTGVDATVAIALRPPSHEGWEEIFELELLRREAASSAAISAEVDPSTRTEWLFQLVTELSHGAALHRAVWVVADRLQLRPPRVVADYRHLDGFDVRAGGKRMLARARKRHALRAPRVPVSGRLQRDLSLGPDASPCTIASALRPALDELSYVRETKGATTIGITAEALAHAEKIESAMHVAADVETWRRGEVPDSAETRLRVLRARVLGAGNVFAAHVRLEPNRDYVIEVSVGPPSQAWLTPDAPFVEPEGPPETPEGWRLRVVLWEPRCIPTPVERELTLPPRGPSRAVSVPFRTGADVSVFGARILVLHGSRVLQTGLLRVDDAGQHWRVDAAPEPVLAVIDTDRWVAASITLNDDVTGQTTATTVNEGLIGVAALEKEVFDDFTSKVSRGLKRIADAPDEYTSLRSDATRSLLIDLAQSGAMMFRALVKGTLLEEDRLERAVSLQIVSTKALTFFPAEFVYGFEEPRDDAELCPGAVEALQKDERCAATHTRKHVCPTGFWSLSKSIERCAHTPANTTLPGPFTLYEHSAPVKAHTLDPLRSVLYAASEKADEVDPQATRAVEIEVTGLAAQSQRVEDWDAWETAIENRRPTMLLLIPHHFGQDRLRIGKDSDLKVVSKVCVQAPECHDTPLVLLIGCETLLTHAAFNNFVQNFLWCGANAVVATYGTILGRQASPATVQLLREISKGLQKGSVRLANVLRVLKRELLLNGQPMILGLTTHGDAELLLERA